MILWSSAAPELTTRGYSRKIMQRRMNIRVITKCQASK